MQSHQQLVGNEYILVALWIHVDLVNTALNLRFLENAVAYKLLSACQYGCVTCGVTSHSVNMHEQRVYVTENSSDSANLM